MMFEIKDLTGLGQPLTKLLEVISSGMGAIYKPIGIRREAKAQAAATRLLGATQTEIEVERSKTLAFAEASNKIVLAEAQDEIEKRAQSRLMHREVLRQQNLEAIANAAVSHMPELASDEPIDDDWKSRFFNIAEDVSNKDMQKLWGRVLAGEVAKPGSYSIRTLEVLRNVTQSEAEAFQRLRYLALDSGAIIKPDDQDLREFGITYEDIMKLREAGLVLDGETMQLTLVRDVEHHSEVLTTNGMVLLIQLPEGRMQSQFPTYALTGVGRELLSLIEPRANMDYFRAIAKRHHSTATMFWGVPGAPRPNFEKLYTEVKS